MAKKQTVWGIDIGNSSLKALRCCKADEPGKIEAVAFDFIEHSKILTQPGAEPAEILAETLQTFLERNNVKKEDRIAISVSGQSTISRFLSLPPVDAKKIPDVIRYEAKQWLPFDLNDVVWDFQTIGLDDPASVGLIENPTVGMFAIKRDIATKTLAPYLGRSVNVDSIQSSPIALYNFVAFDQIGIQEEGEYDPDIPSESLVVLSIGTDATDVVITNGHSIWIRNIPVGGNAFTKALTKELKLTFSKAEYVKRNVAAAQDQRAVIQAMRPVFNDMVNEVHRSLEYYQNLNRKAKFKKIIALGNTAKMPGLGRFLSQNLGYEVTRLAQYNRLVGSDVVDAQLFRDNIPLFGVSYGLALQQLGLSSLKTNLIPKDIVRDRIIREKKPWVLTAASALLLGLSLQFAGASSVYKAVSNEGYSSAESQAKTVDGLSKRLKSETTEAVTGFEEIDGIGKNLTSNVEGRLAWLELLFALNSVLPQDTEESKADDFEHQNRVFIESIESTPVYSFSTWFGPLKAARRYYVDNDEVDAVRAFAQSEEGSEASADSDSTESQAARPKENLDNNPFAKMARKTASAEEDSSSMYEDDESSATVVVDPKKPTAELTETERLSLVSGPVDAAGARMRIVQITGYHYHNPSDPNDTTGFGEQYLRRTLLRNLKIGEVELPVPGQGSQKVSMYELGISYPTLLYSPPVTETEIINPLVQPFLEASKNQAAGRMDGSRRGITASRTRTALPGEERLSPEAELQQVAKKMGLKPRVKLRRFDFIIQFAWVETPPSERAKKKAEEAAAGAATETETEAAPTE
jgi:type IV pilus assembly protein PilM